MRNYEYSQLKVGMSETFKVEITSDMMQMFNKITRDDNPLHNDEAYAKEKGFSGNVVYGMLTASFLSTLAGCYIPGERSLIQSVEVKFARPVYVGDILEISGKISELYDSVQTIILKVEIINQDGVKVLKGKMNIGVI